MPRKKSRENASPPDLLGDDLPADAIAEDAEATAVLPPADPAEPDPEPKPKRDYQPNPVVKEIPAICRRCGGTESNVTKTTKFPRRPLDINGKRYPGRIVRRRTCKACGLHFLSNAPLAADPAPPPPEPCALCGGAGMWAPDGQTPWSEWIKDAHNAARVSATGLKPGICAGCHGSGRAPEPAPEDAESDEETPAAEKNPTP